MHPLLIGLNALLCLVSAYYLLWGDSVSAVFPLLNFLVTLIDLAWVRKNGFHGFTIVFNVAFALLALMAMGAVLSVQLALEEVDFYPSLAYLGPPALVLLPIVNAIFIRARLMTRTPRDATR